MRVALTAILAGSGWAKELRVGAVGDYQPLNFVDEDRERHGFDVDIAVALCKRLRVRCKESDDDEFPFWDSIGDTGPRFTC